jgi:hypothetical protein
MPEPGAYHHVGPSYHVGQEHHHVGPAAVHYVGPAVTKRGDVRVGRNPCTVSAPPRGRRRVPHTPGLRTRGNEVS